MSGFEWFLLIVVVIVVPLVVAVAVTLWTLEQARMRNRKNREAGEAPAGPVKRRATRGTDEVTPAGDAGREIEEETANRNTTTGAGANDGVSRET